jgi:predicted N-acetyltransferase YhbS
VAEIFELLDLAFGEDLSGQERAARAIGLRWEEVSVPFCRHHGGQLIAHVGVLALPLVIDGRAVSAGGIHAVACHPEHRGRGHVRALLEEAIAWAEARHPLLELGTAVPGVYEAVGFRRVPEHRFVGAAPRAPKRPGLRVLDYANPGDVALLHRLLAGREPVSQRFGIAGGEGVFLFDEARRRVHYAPDLDAVLSLELEGTTLRLFDVVAARIPSLAEIAARIPVPVERVEVYFAPERLQADLAPEPHILGGDDLWMVRGPFSVSGPFAMPRTARH